MNILFFLTPKANCVYLNDSDTMRQALERMEQARFAALPILAKDGTYRGTLTEGDLLWAIKSLCIMDLKQTEEHSIMEIAHRKDNRPVSVNTNIEDLVSKATDQNFVPVIDDRSAFIGIVTRRAIMQYCLKNYISAREAAG
jgi:CBS-domain-containing membrane protein